MTTTSFTNGVTLTDAGWFNDADTATYSHLTGVSGTNTIAATGPVSCAAYAAGQRFEFIPANSNTGATTLNITCNSVALGAKNVFSGGVACVGGEIAQNVPCLVVYDGTQFNIIGGTRAGTFTPTVTLVGGAGNTVPVYTTNTGRFTKIGNRYLVDIFLNGDGGAEGAGTGQLTIALPAAAHASFPGGLFLGGTLINSTSTYISYISIVGGTSVLQVTIQDTIGTTLAATGAQQNNTTRSIRLQFQFEAA